MSQSTLAGAADSARHGTETAGDIALMIETWSKRQPQRVNAHEQQEIRRLFREAHRQLSLAEQALEQVVAAQVETQIAANGQPGTSSSYRAKRQRNGAL